jgi:hypothetical protein
MDQSLGPYLTLESITAVIATLVSFPLRLGC